MNLQEAQDLFCGLKLSYGSNHNLLQPYHTIFSSLYCMTAFFACMCNLLLLISLRIHNKNKPIVGRSLRSITRWVSQRNSRRNSRRSNLSEKTRDSLIGYLATFDLLLGLTMPLTALDVLTKYWPLGPNTEIIARLTRAVPTALVYSSSMVITLIAINCYRQILNSSQRQLTPGIVRYLLIPIISISLVISTPIFYFTKLDPLFVDVFKNMEKDLTEMYMSRNLEISSAPLNESGNESTTASTYTNSTNISGINYSMCKEYNDVKLSDISFVIDDWKIAEDCIKKIRLYYSIFSIFAQLIFPFFVISVCYYSVSKRLQKQAEIQTRVMRTDQRLKKENERNKKRNKLLVTISLVYLITWLPLGIFGTLSDANIDFFNNDPESIGMVFVSCHLIGMSSACFNPIIYGFRNKHVRQGNTSIFFQLQSN